MLLRGHRNLREVRDHDHLVGLCQSREHARERHGRGPAHAGVDLVEDQGLAVVRLAQDHLAGKHHAADLAARGYAAERPRREARCRTVQELDARRAAAPPLRAREALLRDLELGRPHLEKRHLLGDRRRQPGRGLGAHGIERVGRLGERGLATLELLGGAALELAAVARSGNHLAGALAALQDVRHARAVGAHEALELCHALLQTLELLGVKVQAARVAAQLRGDVLDVYERALEGARPLSERGVVARRVLERAHGVAQRVTGTALAGYELARPCGSLHEGLAVLHARELGLELLELALARVNLVYAPQHEGGLVEPLPRGAAHLAHALELCRRLPRGVERHLVDLQGLGRSGADPRVEHVDVRLDGEQALVLVLAAEVDGGPHARRELAHARHAPVKLHAPAAVGAHAPAHDRSVFVVAAQEETSLHLEGVRALAHHSGVRALPHQQLDGGEQRRLARARLSREHGEAGGGLDGGVPNERDVARAKLVDHAATPSLAPQARPRPWLDALTCPPARRRRGRPSRRSSGRCGPEGRDRPDPCARRRAPRAIPSRAGRAGRPQRSGA